MPQGGRHVVQRGGRAVTQLAAGGVHLNVIGMVGAVFHAVDRAPIAGDIICLRAPSPGGHDVQGVAFLRPGLRPLVTAFIGRAVVNDGDIALQVDGFLPRTECLTTGSLGPLGLHVRGWFMVFRTV